MFLINLLCGRLLGLMTNLYSPEKLISKYFTREGEKGILSNIKCLGPKAGTGVSLNLPIVVLSMPTAILVDRNDSWVDERYRILR